MKCILQFRKKTGVPADIYFSKLEDKKWTLFEKANFAKGQKAGEMKPNVSYDGKKIYFTAYNTDFTDTSIWYLNRLNNGWSDAIKLDSPLNEPSAITILDRSLKNVVYKSYLQSR